jgi:hypothetical protein
MVHLVLYWLGALQVIAVQVAVQIDHTPPRGVSRSVALVNIEGTRCCGVHMKYRHRETDHASHGRDRAAVDDVLASGDARSAVRCQECDQFSHFLRPVRSTEWDAAE